MKWVLAFLLVVTGGSVAMEADPRPVATFVATEAKIVKTESAKTAVAKFTRTRTPTKGPTPTITQTPDPSKVTATATATRTPGKK